MTVLVADGASGNFEELSALLLSQKAPLAKRFRALFALKAIGTEAAIDVIAKGFDDPSALLCHELAYVLGQMKNQYALNHLFSVLENHKEPMCRHECAEAIGAIKDYSSIERLQSIHDSDKTVQDTILLAIESIKDQSQYVNKYNCIDPAPAGNPLDDNKMILMDQSLDLFTRYRAMFALRDENSISSVKALANGFNDPNPLFRHEIAYVFGQMQNEASVPYLKSVISNVQESPMVRHECCEALGSIASPECLEILLQFSKDECTVVAESCQVGLDMLEYETSEQFKLL